MLPKAVLSIVGRFVGIAAVLMSPLSARAAEAVAPPAPPSGENAAAHGQDGAPKPGVERQSPAHGHRHKSFEKKAKKRGSRHAEGKADKADARGKGDKGDKRDATLAVVVPKSANKPVATSRCDDPEVSTERASAKNPPKQLTAPLATLAAAATKPLVEPISTKAEVAVEMKAHAAEPRRTPIVRASAHSRDVEPPHSEKQHKPACLHAPVAVTRGTEEETFPLTKCDGSVAPNAIEQLSILVRPGSAAKPTAPIADALPKTGRKAKEAAGKDDELAPGIKKIDERLVERLQLVIDHFAKPDTTPKVFVVSGYRPTSKGSFHALGRAIDFRVNGVENTDLVAFCKTLPDTGCGFYPNSSFIHLDVRESGAGHVSWIDASGPGEKPDYVAEWPLPPTNDEDAVKRLSKLDELQLLPPPATATVQDKETDAEGAKPEAQAQQEDAKGEKGKEPAVSLTRKLEDQ